jgi:HlyD family secretion protein
MKHAIRQSRPGLAGTLAALLALVLGLTGCKKQESDRVQGYAEGEFVYVASPLAGQLDKLAVKRGQQVKANEVLFALDPIAEKAARDQAAKLLAQAKATYEDSLKGKRPTEMASLEAQLKQAHAALVLSEQEQARQEKLMKSGATSADDLDKARSTNDQNRHRVEQLDADIGTGKLGLRDDQIAAAQADMHAREAALAKADWDLSQKQQEAPQAGLVFDTLYYQGEWVAAGRPVVVLLPPQNIKVRAFVPEAKIGSVHAGDEVKVFVDGVAEPMKGHVTFISPQAEYTPPVIYSQESRDKLVFLIEARFDPEIAVKLHPGQPVDVKIGP